jgi:cytochrome c553
VELGDPRQYPAVRGMPSAGAGGPIETPVLAEQQDEYIVQQLKRYASGERRNDVYGRMRRIASRLTDDEIRGLARYYRAGFR